MSKMTSSSVKIVPLDYLQLSYLQVKIPLPSSPMLRPTPPTLHPLLRFALIATGLYLLWFFGYEHYLTLDGRLDDALTHNIAAAAAILLRTLGLDASVSTTDLSLILIAKVPTVSIYKACNGMVLYALFTGFVIAFPSSSLHKLWFIPLGVILIYGVNILRIVALCLNYHYYHKTADFNHHYTFAFIEYGFICLLWLWWAVRLSEPFTPSPASNAYA